MDNATRQLRTSLGINVHNFDKNKGKSVVNMLACVDTEKRHTSQQMWSLFTATMQQFGIAKEHILCLVVDYASNMTKMVEHLNEDDSEADSDNSQDEEADEFQDYNGIEESCAMRVNIHHMRYAVHILQLAIKDCLKQPNCNKLLTKTSIQSFQVSFSKCFVLVRKKRKNRQYLI